MWETTSAAPWVKKQGEMITNSLKEGQKTGGSSCEKTRDEPH